MKIKTGYKVDNEGNVYIPSRTLYIIIIGIIVISIFFWFVKIEIDRKHEERIKKIRMDVEKKLSTSPSVLNLFTLK